MGLRVRIADTRIVGEEEVLTAGDQGAYSHQSFGAVGHSTRGEGIDSDAFFTKFEDFHKCAGFVALMRRCIGDPEEEAFRTRSGCWTPAEFVRIDKGLVRRFRIVAAAARRILSELGFEGVYVGGEVLFNADEGLSTSR